MSRVAEVFYQDLRAGLIRETDRGYRFTYDPEFVRDGTAISLTLPLREEPFESASLFSFFAGLIPEGWYLRIVAHTIKVDPSDEFGLLIRTCGDCIGAVGVREVEHA